MEHAIYALRIKGTDDSFFYVGRTSKLKTRIITHKQGFRDTHCGCFIGFLSNLSIDFEVIILNVLDDRNNDINKAEIGYIKHFCKKGYFLMNKQHNPYATYLSLWPVYTYSEIKNMKAIALTKQINKQAAWEEIRQWKRDVKRMFSHINHRLGKPFN